MVSITDAQIVRDLGAALQKPFEVAGTPVLAVPEQYRTEDLSHMLPAPLRKKGVFSFDSLASFLAFVLKHKTDSTAIYFTRNTPPKQLRVFTAVINGHGAEPGWGDFKAVHTLNFSRQFAAWSSTATRDQKEFAEFLEDRIGEVAVPDGAKLFEIASTLEATQTATYSKALKLSNGDVQFTYSKETKSGALTVPEKITVVIPVWQNGIPQTIDIKLRWRLVEDHVTFKLEIERQEDLIDAMIDAACFAVSKDTGCPVYHGSI